MSKEWRPQDDWINPFSKEERPLLPDDKLERIYEAGASAMLKALIKWLFEPCTEHIAYIDEDGHKEYMSHHINCSLCIEQLNTSRR